MTNWTQAMIVAAFEKSVRELYEQTGTRHCCARFELCIYKAGHEPIPKDAKPVVEWQFYTHERGIFNGKCHREAFVKTLDAHAAKALLAQADELQRQADTLRATAALQAV